MSSDEALLGNLMLLMDALKDRDRIAYRESCQCGASITIAIEVPATERKRMVAGFLGRHNHPSFALIEPGDEQEAKAAAWDEGFTTGNRHNGRRDANPYRVPVSPEEGDEG